VSKPASEFAVELRDVRKSFGKTEIIRGTSLAVKPGERVAIIGAVLLVIALVLLSELTKAWLLYLGIVFLIMVMYAPGGIASLIMMNLRVAAFGRLKELWVSYLALAITALIVLLGAAAMIEMVYHLQLNAALGPKLKFLGMNLDARGADSWFGAIFVMATGIGLFEATRRHFSHQWGEIQGFIEKEMKRRETL